MATHTPTHILYLALPTKAQKPDGKSKAQWRRIGAVWKHKNLGASITWDCTPVPTSPGRTVILPYAERKPDAEEK
jgi:hypothetical protein